MPFWSARPAVLVVLALLALAAPASATWSIVLTDHATGEVAVATATCLEDILLKIWVPVIVTGVGAGVTQSQVDMTAGHKKTMVAGLKAGDDPAAIIAAMQVGDLFKCSRQFAVADLLGRRAAFSGGCNGQWKGHRTGQIGSITYSVQGNVLTGEPVLLAAEAALLATDGLLSDRLMAAMIAAAELGGDGRCSCLTGPPPSCGAPPAGGFEKSSHVASFIVARVGDSDGTCLGATGCATGDYWMELNITGNAADPDPVALLVQEYDAAVTRLRGVADALASEVLVSPATPAAGGQWTADLEVDLRDLHDLSLPAGGAVIEASHAPGSAGLFTRQRVVDHGDGSYTVTLVAPAPPEGLAAPVDLVSLRVRDGHHEATLYPFASVAWGR